ncbi:MAG TPA: undecaprenyl-diphosphate phosphatase [Nitrososphaeraceae archaeon]|nr:undecaprenyl-diphosphate phosphatase [Nitrososphaeraceae archaeon]
MIDVIQALILGIVQGLTEWLPISSSGHLALVQLTMNLEVPIFFDIVLHFGTLTAVIGIYRRELLGILMSIKPIGKENRDSTGVELMSINRSRRYLLLIILGMIPTALIGIGFRSIFEESFYSMWSIGLGFLITGAMIFVTKFIDRGTHSIRNIDAILIGIGQGLSIFSSISRSGATISIGMFRHIERSELITFSFLLSIPAIVGAGLYDLVFADSISQVEIYQIPIESYIIGTFTAAIVGYVSIKFLINIINKGEFYLFSFYCFLLGSLILVSLI